MKYGVVINVSLMLVASTGLHGMRASLLRSGELRRAGCHAVQQYAVIKPFFLNENLIDSITTTMDYIDNKKFSYSDYSRRKGLIWSDLEITKRSLRQEEYFGLKECPETIKLTNVLGKLQVQRPQSVMDYDIVRGILAAVVLPKMINTIQEKKWADVPDSAFAQFFLQRCHNSEEMSWHQDPGEDYDRMADFSLILLLSKKDDPQYGWEGGMFAIKTGLPTDKHDEADVTVVEPVYNQAFLFNNKLNSHAVTAVKNIAGKLSKRDLMVVTLYLDGKRPKPVVLPSKFGNDLGEDSGTFKDTPAVIKNIDLFTHYK
jgi:hypothetical protein